MDTRTHRPRVGSGRRAVCRLRRATTAAVLAPAVLGLATALALATAAPVSAHTGTLPDAQYYRSTVSSITPATQGLQIGLVSNGESITMTNHTGKIVVVLGYTGEQYLRISPTGVEENVNSLSSFLNGSLVISGLAQQLNQSQQQKSPEWKKVSDKPTFTWHDHRIHWMAQQQPPVVAADPHHPHRVFDWSMNLTVDNQPVVVKGTLTWLGSPVLSGLMIALMVTVGTVLAALIGLLILRRRVSRRRSAQAPAPDRSDHEFVP